MFYLISAVLFFGLLWLLLKNLLTKRGYIKDKTLPEPIYPEFHDVQELGMMFPHKFKAPPKELLDCVGYGSMVKIGAGNQRIPIEVKERDGDHLAGAVISKEPIDVKGFEFLDGDIVDFKLANIYEVQSLKVTPVVPISPQGDSTQVKKKNNPKKHKKSRRRMTTQSRKSNRK